MRRWVDFQMQKWFNNLNLLSSIILCGLLTIGGISLIMLRMNNHTPIGAGIGILLIIESIILIYKKYFSTK